MDGVPAFNAGLGSGDRAKPCGGGYHPCLRARTYWADFGPDHGAFGRGFGGGAAAGAEFDAVFAQQVLRRSQLGTIFFHYVSTG